MKSNITICQIGNPDVFLPCEEKVGSLRCEQLEIHEKHWLGDHTIQHKILGKKYSCEEVELITATAPKDGNGKAESRLSKFTRRTSSPTNKLKRDTHFSKVGAIAFIAAIFILPITLGAAYSFITSNNEPLFTPSGDIVAKNHDIVPFKGEVIEGVNPEQKALADGKRKTDPPAFIFTNGEVSKNRQDVHVYVSFSDQASRDFLNLNAATLKAFVESGKIDLYVHVVPATDVFGLYAPELLAEAFYFSPEHGWDILVELLKFANENYNKDFDANELSKALASLANNSGVVDVTADGIQNGTFSSWLYSLSSADKVAMGLNLPSVYVGDKNIPIKSLDLTGNDSFNKALGLME